MLRSADDSDIQLDEQQLKIYDIIENSKNNVFIQGQAGTGKSTLIDYLRHNSVKSIVVACPTALAATNISGSTLHSLFRLPPKDYYDANEMLEKRNSTNDSVLKYMDVLIIDEISMVRPDLLDTINAILKDVRNSKKPFGGVQIILVGDLYQLPPIVKSGIKKIFEDTYGFKLPYFFDSKSYKEGKFQNFELTIVHRQEDNELLENLRKLRSGENIKSALNFFNAIPKLYTIKDSVVITPYRAKADSINQIRLDMLPGSIQEYEAEVTGSFKNLKELPGPEKLILKEGAFVMFTKNDKNKQWINGNTGIIRNCGTGYITVELTESHEEVFVFQDVWSLIRYDYDKKQKKIIEQNIGEFKQYPLQLAYATTIHKAQSKTLDRVVIDTDRGVFAPGQLYVALSRTRKRTDMSIRSYLTEKDVILDGRIEEFLKENLNEF